MSAYRLLLDKLAEHGSAVQANGVHGRAECPAHPDPDLSLRMTGINGKVVFHCPEPGCQRANILAALHLNETDLHDQALDELEPVEPPTVDAEVAAMETSAAFAREVEYEAYRLRVREAARDKVAAEAVTETDFDGLYLDRDQLRDLPTTEPLIGRVLPRHSYAVLRGRDHSFKSFVLVDWACCLATGKAWQGHYVEQVPVLYVAGEGAYGIAGRVAAWEAAWQTTVDPKWLTVRSAALNLHKPGPAFEDLLQRIEVGNYGLVVVDTLRRVSGAADGNSSDMGAVVDNLDRVKRATDNGSVVTAAHTDKGDHDARGYSGIEDDADVVWHAKREEMSLSLELTKMKDGPDGTTIHLQAVSVAGSLVLQHTDGTTVVNTTESQVRILDTMREMFRDGTYGGDLLRATGLSETTFYRALSELQQAGHLANTGTRKRKFWELSAAGSPT